VRWLARKRCPFFGLDTPHLKDVCLRAELPELFDYVNAGADLVVGYMGGHLCGRPMAGGTTPLGQLAAGILVEPELDACAGDQQRRLNRRAAVQEGIGAYDIRR